MEAIGSPLVFDTNSIDQPGKAVAQALHGAWLAPPPAFETRDVTLLVGANPLVSYQMGLPLANPGRELTAAIARGMRLIVIDPRRTETARRAHLHLQCRPGHDLVLVAAMLNVIFRENLFDGEFVKENVTGLEALRTAVTPFEPELVGGRAGVPVADLFKAARIFAAGRGVATAGTAPSFKGQGTLFEYLLLALNTVCGQWSRAGDTVTHTGTLTPPFPAIAKASAPHRGYGYEPLEPAAAPGTPVNGGKVDLDMELPPSTDELFEILARDARVPLEEVKKHPHGAIFRDDSLVVEGREPGWTERLDVANPEMLADLAKAADDFENDRHTEAEEHHPYRLINGRLIHTYNTNGQDLEGLRRKWPYNPAFMHPDDLDREALSAGGYG